MFKLIGLLIVLFSVFGGYLLEGGIFVVLWQPVEILIIAGAGIGSLFVATPIVVLKQMAAQLKVVLTREQTDPELYPQLLILMRDMITQIQTDGLIALDKTLENPDESPIFRAASTLDNEPVLRQFIIDNFRLQTIGKIEPHDLEALLEEEIERIEEDKLRSSKSLSKMADSMPGFGILAAILGMVITMSNIDGDISMIGVRVAAALMGSFLGIFFCYALLDPLSKSLEMKIGQQTAGLKCVAAIMVSFLQGKPMLQALEAGRKQIQIENKMSFLELEKLVREHGRA